MRILAFNPYHGGSHAQFIDQWIAHSKHQFSLVTLPPRHFSWRIRQAAVGMAEAAKQLVDAGENFDLLWTTSMVDVAELRGLLPPALRSLPLVVYFHENQLVYPVQKANEKNERFALINWVSALAGDELWFNSQYNLNTLLAGLDKLLRKMPDEKSLDTLQAIRLKSQIQPLGIESIGQLASQGKTHPALHIAWVARWEHDKHPEQFFAALKALKALGVNFRLTCLGQSFRKWPPAFDQAQEDFQKEIVQFGFMENRREYHQALRECDVVVSTADHEFFGIALLEGVSGGLIPLVPRRLVYPEIYPDFCLYGGAHPKEGTGTKREDEDEGALVKKLLELAEQKKRPGGLTDLYNDLRLKELSNSFDWKERAPALDRAVEICSSP